MNQIFDESNWDHSFLPTPLNLGAHIGNSYLPTPLDLGKNLEMCMKNRDF